MKKLQIKEMETVQGGSPRMCWTLAGMLLVTPFTTSGGLIVGAACYISSL